MKAEKIGSKAYQESTDEHHLSSTYTIITRRLFGLTVTAMTLEQHCTHYNFSNKSDANFRLKRNCASLHYIKVCRTDDKHAR